MYLFVVSFRYGGLYLDCDIIVLKPLSSLNNTVGLEDRLAGSSQNGAVMLFRKHSPFILDCLTEFYSTYDDTRLLWNGAALLTRVARNFLRDNNTYDNPMELKVQPSFIFFPISRNKITRYFYAPVSKTERAQEDELFKKMLNESFTFHFWNSLTSALVPESESLAARLINHHCIRCFDVL
ncbi:lactosylceramide 4-alpha-galactosyltransferase [Sarracenia purpurea var. burkii]